MREQVAVLGVEQDRPEVLSVVVLVAEQVAGELDYGFRGVKFARGRLPGLAHDGPGCNLQAVTLRGHFWDSGHGRKGRGARSRPGPRSTQNGTSSVSLSSSVTASAPESAASRCAGLPRG